ncbi:uromodulin-like 1 [Pseudochaenichthys georgianus]|uniref:uromodulin-like 1 n=1 Tax=Pseudochaenichthys georgianus TaxID=52239 RepID=UPI00146C55C0|nr:uromodulin-like 1 [Pseudochaenichthys georgianus]
MSWMLSICVATALLALCRGQNTEHEGNSLSASGYRLCTYNETRNVSLLVMHAVPYTVTKPCGGWLHWKTCTVTLYRMTHETETRTVKQQVTRCCPGHVQVGRYCALPVNRSDEFTAKPGSCPTADGVQNRSEGCEWDIDCPGWQKCCQSCSRYVCSDPANSTYYSDNGGYRFNATVTVKTDYQPLVSTDRGLLDHTRLLQAMVTGALQSDVKVYYLSSQPVHPFRTATSILIACNLTLSLHTVTSELHLLLKHIQEVSSVTVEDVDECALSALRGCSPHSDCNNTVGSYLCSCHQGYVDVDPSNPGADCTADVRVTPEPCLTSVPPMNTTTVSASNSTQEHVRNITEGSFSSTGTSMPTAQSNTSTVAYNSSNAPQWTSSAPYSSLRSTVESPLPTTTCYPANITSVWAADVTGTSFRVHWSSQFQTNQTYQVDLSKRSEVIHSGVTSQTMMEMRDLQPGVLYTVAVTPSSCQQGITLDISVKTDAQKLEATTRLTNIEFSADLQNGSSQAYQNLTESITQEIYQSLSPEMKAMVDSGQMRIEITSFSQGSVFVHFTMTLAPSESQDIANVSTALQYSLLNSTKYTVDKNNTSTHDFNECTMGENDCSLLATCTNAWASYTCVCLDGFIDNNPKRPGRACHAITTTPTSTTTTATAPPTTINPPTPSIAALITTIAPTITTTAPTTTTSTLPTTITAPTTTPIAPTTKTAAPPTTTTAPTATITTPTTTIPTTTAPTTITAPTPAITALTTTTTANIYTTAAPTATITTPTITTVAPATTITAPTTTTTANITTTAAHTTTITAAAITNTAPISTMSSSATTTTAATTITITTPTTAPVITPCATAIPTTAPTTASTTTLTAATTTPNALTTIMTAPVITTSAMISMTSTPSTGVTNPTSTITAPPSTTTTLRTAPSASTLGEISVQCRVAAITVTVSRAFLLSNNIRESSLYLGLPECGVNGGNALHAQLTVAWDECGTSLMHNETYYMASVPLFNTMDMYTSDSGTVEAPKIQLEVPILCSYMKSMLISADFGSMGYDMIKDLIITGSGEFQVTVQLMNGTMPLPHNYSLSSEEAVVVEVSLNTSSQQIKVVINKCWATPTLHPVDISSYIFLENSCSMNTYTTVLMNGNSSSSRVSVQIFSFIDLDVIYLHCQVQICVQTGSGSCVPDCQQRTAQSSNTIGTAFCSSGPLLRSNEESLEEESDTLHLVGLSCLGIGVSLFFIMGFVCLFYYQRNRIGHYNFSAKPKQENFTYLVFNT